MTEVMDAPLRAQEITAGTLLRRAREASGLHVAALAVSLKVPVRKLEALEDDRYHDVGDAVFVRGLASSVCRSLKVDPQPVLERLPQPAAPRLIPDTEALNTPYRAPSDARPDTWLDRIRQPVPATVIGLLVAALVIYFVPIPQLDNIKAAQPVAAGSPGPAPEPSPAIAMNVTTNTNMAPGFVAMPPGASQPAQAIAADAQAAPSAALTSTTAAPAAESAPAPNNGIVTIRTKGATWVEVVDAKGGVAVRKLLAPGESVGAGGVLPLQVTIGRADQTEVEVRGSRYDLRPVSRDNVARFEIR